MNDWRNAGLSDDLRSAIAARSACERIQLAPYDTGSRSVMKRSLGVRRWRALVFLREVKHDSLTVARPAPRRSAADQVDRWSLAPRGQSRAATSPSARSSEKRRREQCVGPPVRVLPAARRVSPTAVTLHVWGVDCRYLVHAKAFDRLQQFDPTPLGIL